MADFAQRGEVEATIAKRLGKAGRDLFRLAVELLGDEPNISKLSAEFWQTVTEALGGAVQKPLEDAVTQHMQQRIGETGIGIEFGQVNERAARWAREHTFDLVKGISDNTRTALQQQIEGYYRDGRTLKDLQDSISNLFGPVRAEMIAITETTRAANAAESLFEDELQALGLKTQQVWQTATDETVCEICEPLDGKAKGDGWTDGPPAHPRCRCWTTTEVVKD